MISIRARMLRFMFRLQMRGVDRTRPVENLRAWLDELGSQVPPPGTISVQQVSVGGMHAEWVTPAGAPDDTVILYLHGGGYVMGSCRSHRGLVGTIAAASGLRALIPQYRLAPEYPFPAALEDAVTAYRWLLDNGISPTKIVLCGDSSGGGLAVALLLLLREQGIAMPAGAALLSPWTDLAATGESFRTRRRKDPWLRSELLAELGRAYADASDLEDPLISPVHADLSGLPRLFVQVGDFELLLSDSTRLVDNARRAGVEADVQIWAGMWHVWHAFAGRVPESDAAIDDLAAFLRLQVYATEPEQRAA